MTSVRFTSWARLEPSISDPELRPGLVAETADPLWFLARQWQLGELTGDDASSPALVEVQAEIGQPTHVRLGENGAIAAYDPSTTPLDVLAEREPAPSSASTLFTAEVSLMLREELEASGMGVRARQAVLTDLRAAFPLPGLSVTEAVALSPATAALLDGVAPVAFDGVAVVRAAAAQLPSTAVGAAWDEAVALVAAWVDRRLPPTSAWVPRQLGSRVELGVPGAGSGVTFLADRAAGDQLGWWSFDRATTSLGAGTTVTATAPVQLPAATARVPGAPAARYWEMEDAAIDLGAVGVAPNELARLIVLEYLLVYGNDMVVVPFDVPYGSRCVVTDVTVIDVSGERTTVAAVTTASGGTFRLWEVTGDPGALLAPPVAMATISGPVIEDVVVARDEQSNLAWLIERTGTDPAGGPVDLRRLAPPPRPPVTSPPPPPDAPRPPWRWRLTEEPPLGWHPLLPEADPTGATRLVVGAVPVGAAPVPPPRSRILEELAVSGLPLAAVPAEGVRLQRRSETARWIDGSRHTWLARERRSGSGDAGSGVLFDVVEGGTA